MFLTASPYVYNMEKDQLCYNYLINAMLRKNPLTNYFKKDKSDNNDNIINMMYDSNPVNPIEFQEEYYTGNMSLSFKEMAYSLDLENLSNTTTSKSRISKICNCLDDKPLNNYTETEYNFYKHFTDKLRNLFEDETKNNKVVIFVKFEYEGRNIIKHLCKEIGSSQQIHKFRTNKNKEKSICFIMAKFGDDTLNTLTQKYNTTNKDDVPDVLILSSAIGSTRINLPAYNYVINFHIGKNCAEFEQRFGRIDRYNSINNELHNIFVISKFNKRYSLNFIYAMHIYITKISRFIPTKNIFINNDTIKLIRNFKNSLKEIMNSLSCDTIINEICEKIGEKFDQIAIEEYYDKYSIKHKRKISIDRKKDMSMDEIIHIFKSNGEAINNKIIEFLNDLNNNDLETFKKNIVNYKGNYINSDDDNFYDIENTLDALIEQYKNQKETEKEIKTIKENCNNILKKYDENKELFESSQNILFNGNVITLNGIIDKIINNLNLNIDKEELLQIQNNSIERCITNMFPKNDFFGENHGNLYNYLNSIENGTFKNHLNDLKAILSQGIMTTYHISHYKDVELPEDFLNYIIPKKEPTWNIITNNIISKFNISEKDIVTFISICYKKQLFKIQYNNKIYDCFSAIAYNDKNSLRVINLAQLTKDKNVWQNKNIAYVFFSDSLIEKYGPIENTNMLNYLNSDDFIIHRFKEFYRKEYFEKKYVDQAFKEYSSNLNSENVAIRIDTKDVIPQYLQENREVCNMIRSIICYTFQPFSFHRTYSSYDLSRGKNSFSHYGQRLSIEEKMEFDGTIFKKEDNINRDVISIDDKYILLNLPK